jgi:ankyrin repeat protein
MINLNLKFNRIFVLMMLASIIVFGALEIALADINDDLIEAAKQGDTEKVQEMIDQAADVNAAGSSGRYEGYTALIFAAWIGHTEVVQILLDNGADVNAAREDGDTALDIAKNCGYTEIVELIQSYQ